MVSFGARAFIVWRVLAPVLCVCRIAMASCRFVLPASADYEVTDPLLRTMLLAEVARVPK
jgi:hypothetical protein